MGLTLCELLEKEELQQCSFLSIKPSVVTASTLLLGFLLMSLVFMCAIKEQENKIYRLISLLNPRHFTVLEIEQVSESGYNMGARPGSSKTEVKVLFHG